MITFVEMNGPKEERKTDLGFSEKKPKKKRKTDLGVRKKIETKPEEKEKNRRENGMVLLGKTEPRRGVARLPPARLRRGAPAAAWTRCGCGVGTRAAAQDGGSAGEAAALGRWRRR